jgi:hypothetical protein
MYRGKHEQQLTRQKGRFECADCHALVHEWDGVRNYFNLEIHPEEVEDLIHRHPQGRMSLVHPRKNPITSAIVVPEVVLREEAKADSAMRASEHCAAKFSICAAPGWLGTRRRP